MVSRILKGFVVAMSLIFVLNSPAFAGHFEATIPQGLWMEVWMFHIESNKLTGSKGGDTKAFLGQDNFKFKLNQLLLRPVFSGKYFIFDAQIPIGRMKIDGSETIGVYDKETAFLGDIWVHAWLRNENASAAWRPLGINMAPGIGVKFPTGSYEKDRLANLGGGHDQYDARLDFRFSKFFFEGNPFGESWKWAVEGDINYVYRFEDRARDVKPGNVLNWNIGVNTSLGSNLRAGWDVAGNFKEYDRKCGGSKLDTYQFDPLSRWGYKISTGPTMYWVLTQNFHLGGVALVDIDARNQTKGYTAYLRWYYYWDNDRLGIKK
ncbi:MAG: transporter [Syntrophobacterales bacterium]|nr:transporter [Syntrophobacterales bacterium]